MRPFENPSNVANNAAGMTYKQGSRAALLAGGIGLAAWYLSTRRDARKSPAEDLNIGDPIPHPKTGAATREGGDRSHKH